MKSKRQATQHLQVKTTVKAGAGVCSDPVCPEALPVDSVIGCYYNDDPVGCQMIGYTVADALNGDFCPNGVCLVLE